MTVTSAYSHLHTVESNVSELCGGIDAKTALKFSGETCGDGSKMKWTSVVTTGVGVLVLVTQN